jgi:hypothetical protein
VNWTDALVTNPAPWLLERENPPARYGALRDLLDRPADDPDLQAAQAIIPSYPPVAELLAAQKPGGYWVKPDYYLPKYDGTFWTLIVLADLGLTRNNEQIHQACEYMFTFQRESGAFCRRRRVSGKGLVWTQEPAPCTHARIVRTLIQFGYGDDPRTRAGVDWILADQRPDGMWHCREDRYNCLRATLDARRSAGRRGSAAPSHAAWRRGRLRSAAEARHEQVSRWQSVDDSGIPLL